MIKLGGIHVVKRGHISRQKMIVLRVLAVLLALFTGGVFILGLGHNPFAVYGTMISGSVGSAMVVKETVKQAVPLLIASLGITLAFRMQFWNIGAEGQICFGATCATYFALFHSDWPQWVLLAVMCLAAAIGGGLLGVLPAYFKARFGTNETLFTLMLNYVALYLIQYLRDGPWKSPEAMGFNFIARFAKNAQLPQVLGVHVGWIFALALVVFTYVYLNYTKHGYEISVVGGNSRTARYAGMNNKWIIIRTMFLSAAICGVAGMIQVAGPDRTLTDSVAGGVGFTAIIIAYLGQLNPIAILLVTVLFSILEKGSGTVQSTFNISTAAADVLQGILLFFVLGSEFFLNYRIVWHKEDADRGGIKA